MRSFWRSSAPLLLPPPTPAPRWNYPVDVFARWKGRFFYVMMQYACPGPDAALPFFETGLARLEYAGSNRFHLAYHRHTGQWHQIGAGLTLEECLEFVREAPVFQP